MNSRTFIYPFGLHLVLLALSTVVSIDVPPVGNAIADAEHYPEPHPANGSTKTPASRDHRAVREGEGRDPHQDVAIPKPPSHVLTQGSCNSMFMVQCLDGMCISKNFVCDNSRDCPDGSDEDCQVQTTKSGKCKNDTFPCDNGKCIPISWHCDTTDDCGDKSDERGCEVKCPVSQFKCRSGKCVAPSSLCDGVKDCDGEEDEENCGKSHCHKIPGFYQCESGDCVPAKKVCDDTKDCEDGSDEGKACASKCKANNCTDLCYPTPKGPHCSCKKGLTLQSDLVTCTDENECERQYTLVCDHFCENTNGSFRCSCESTYTLQEDGVTCKHKQPGNAFLLVAQRGSIRQLFLDGSRYTQIYSGRNESIVGLAYDPETRSVFWGTNGRILKAPMIANTVPTTLLDQGIIMAEGLAVDWIARNLYIADLRMFHILACNLEGTACHPVLKHLGHPRTVQLDMLHRHMYWTDVKHGNIGKAGMDGSNPTVLVQDGLVWPNALALDPPADRLYWLDAHSDEAHSVRLDGSNRKSLHLATLKHPFSMALWEDRLYWTDWSQSHVVSCIKRDGKHVRTELKGISKRKYFGLVLYHPAMMERVDNPCSSAQCSHLCLLSPNPAGYTCACPNGILHLAQDNHTCIDNPDRIYVLVNSFKKMYWLSPHHYGRSDIQAWMPNLLLGDIGDVEYFPGQDLVFVSDQYDEKIYSINMKTSYATILVDNTVARRMAFDWVRHNLYWLDSASNVQVMRLTMGKGSHRTIIIRGLSSPLDIAVAPLAGLLFVSTASTNPQSQGLIQQCGLDGKSCITIVDSQIQRPLTLAVDHKHNHLYWGDHSLGRIERINFNGLKRIQILPPTELAISTAVVSLMITGDYLSWTVAYERTLYTVRTDSMRSEAPKMINLFLDPNEGKMLKLTRVKWELPDEMTGKERPCQNNGGCSDICVSNRLNKEVCLCQFSSQLGSDGKTCEKVQCEEHLFACVSSLRCIPLKWRCDGSPDCSDKSDEAGCQSNDEGTDKIASATMPSVQCPDDHLCDTDKCLPKPFVCDDHVDCEDESDEANCTHVACPVGQVRCLKGRCIGKMWLCDGDKDCPDGSDEENCPIKCSTDQYPCDNKCIANNATCDGKKDCDDGKDEEESLCGGQRNRVCPAGKIPCLSTHTSGLVCIGHEQRCNGVQDCPRGEDESHNVCSDCTREEFQCPASQICISLRYLCDGHLDCEPDGADEVNCTNPTTATTTDLQSLGDQGPCGDDFRCEDGQCLPNSKVCDGRRDCIDGSDEQKSCQLRCDVMKCQHNCHSTPTKAYCSCHAGYHLAPDFRSCLDDQECMDEGWCSQGCEERVGTFQCTCLPGYRLVDSTTCKREAGEDWLALVIHAGILNFTHNLQLQDAFPSTSVMFDYITSFAVDPMTEDIFFSDEHRRIIGKLTRADGVIKEEIILRERSLLRSLCYDPRQRNLYVAELFGGPRERSERSVGGSRNQGDQDTAIPTEILWSSIMACNLDGKGCSVVFGSNVSDVTSVAVAVTEELLFFCNNYVKVKTGQLMTSYLDGTIKKEIWGKIVRCSNLALDEAKRRVYWADLTQETIETVTWEGDGHHFVHRKQQVWFPVGLAVSGPNVFWVNSGSNQMIHCPKLHDRGDCYKSDHPTTLLGLFVAPLPVVNEQKECDNASCSHLCVSGGSGCVCLAGYQKSITDLTKCEKLTACDTHQCEGGGTCEAHTAEHFVCRCPDGRYGYKCELGEVIGENSNAAVTATVVVVIIIVVLMLALLYWWKRCPFTIWKRRGHGSGQQGFHYVNPAFGVIRDEPILEGEAQPERGNGLYPRLPHEHPPPYAPPPRSSSLIQNFANSPATMHKDSQINTSDDSAVASTTDSILASQQSEVSLATPICQHLTVMEDNKDFSKFDYSPFNPSKV